MASWIYPVGNKVYQIELKDGTLIPLNTENFEENLLKDNIPSIFWWHVWGNYDNVIIGDDIYLYATQRNKKFGIIGYAKIVDKEIDGRKYIKLKLDISKSKKIIENPLYLSSKICHIPMRPLGKVHKNVKVI